MPKLNEFLKLKIVHLVSEGKKHCEILKTLKEQADFTIDRHNLLKFIRHYSETQSIVGKPKKGPAPTNVTPSILDFIDKTMERNDETTSPELRRLLPENHGVDFSTSKIKILRRSLGWLSSGTKYCQLVREVNRAKRIEFCTRAIQTNETFGNVIFTDECTVALENHARITFRRWWEPPSLKGCPKHPLKVHVWAGISRKGATDIGIFTGIMDAEFFVEEILKNHLEPFIEKVFPDGHRFQQDNDPKHTSTRAKDYLKESGINWWVTPPESPDLNPIELVWHELKHFLRKTHKPTTKEDLIAGIKQF